MQIKNSTTKQVKEVTDAEWKAINENPLVKGWFPIPAAKKPKELEAFEAAKKPAATTETAKEETPKNTSK